MAASVDDTYVWISQYVPDTKQYYNMFVRKAGNEEEIKAFEEDLKRSVPFLRIKSTDIKSSEVDTIMKYQSQYRFHSSFDVHNQKCRGNELYF